jgi:PEP-CTERM motif
MLQSHVGTALAGLIAATAIVSPAAALPISLLTTIAIPSDSANTQPGGEFNEFDISFFNPATGTDYVADRSNAAVDVFGGLAFLGRTPDIFAGEAATHETSGPDGVVVVNSGSSHILFAGDYPSLLRTFTLSSAGLPTGTAFPALNTGGTFRVDEMSYSPSANLVLVANNADTPAFATLVNASTGTTVVGHIVVPNTVGMEASVWDPHTGTFFVSVPQFGASPSDPGGIAEISTSGVVLNTFHFSSFGISSCSPAGLVLGASGHLMAGCSNSGTQTIVFDPTANAGKGAIVKTFSEISGSDELWYDPNDHDFYVTGTTASGSEAFDIINDTTLNILASVSLPDVDAHSIAVDPFNGDVYVPLEGGPTNTLCSLGCMAVYGPTSVPEPGTLPLMVAGLASLIGVAARRARRSG